MITSSRLLRRLGALSIVTMLLGTACGGDDDGGAASAPATTVSKESGSGGSEDGGGAADSGATAPDACAATSDKAASDLIGREVAGQQYPSLAPGTPYAACTWGEITDGTMLSIQVAGEQDGVRTLQLLVTASATDAVDSEVGAEGRFLPSIGYIPGGGGIGSSVFFRHGAWDVLIGVTGETPPAKDVLERFAADVDAALP